VGEFRTVLFYLLGLVGLIVVSAMFTGQVEVVVNDLPATTPAVVVIPTVTGPDTATLTGMGQSDCVPSAMAISYIYSPNAPFTTTLTPPNLKGERLIVSGTVVAADQVTPLPGALLEVWQADAEGQYENLRAQMQTDALGRYQFTTIKPGHYRVDCKFLPAHIHYRVSYLDDQPLFTLLFFEGDPYLANAPAVKLTHIRPLTTQAEPNGPVLHTIFNIALPVYLDGEG